METYREYSNKIRKVSEPRRINITNSYTTRNAFTYYRNNRIQTKDYVLQDVEFDKIIKRCNELIIEELCAGRDFSLPYGLGKLTLRKYKVRHSRENNKLVDWNRTLKLWYEDKECEEEKFLVFSEDNYKYKLICNIYSSPCKNRKYFAFKPSRVLLKRINKLVSERKLDAHKS